MMEDEKMKIVSLVEEQVGQLSKTTLEELTLVYPNLTRTEDLLIPAPLVISLMAKLILMSNKNDFTLTQPIKGFKYLQYTSFRAAFAQMTHRLQDAFRLAHQNMNAINYHANDIPKQYNRAIKIIQEMPVDEMQGMLAIPLQKMKTENETCLKMAQDIEKRFDLVIQMTAELVESLVDTQHQTAGQLKKYKQEKEGLQLIEESVKIRKEDNENQLKQLDQSMKEAEVMYKKTFNESNTMVYTMAFAELASDTMKSCAQTVVPMLAMMKAKTCGSAAIGAVSTVAGILGERQQEAQGIEVGAEASAVSEQLVKDEAEIEAYKLSEKISELAIFLVGLVENKTQQIDEAKLTSGDHGKWKVQFTELKRTLASKVKRSTAAQEAIDVCSKGFNICSQLDKHIETPGTVNVAKLIEDINSMHGDSKTFQAKADVKCNPGTKEFHPTKTCSATKGKGSLTNAAVSHVHMKMESQLAFMKQQQERFAAAQEERKQIFEQMHERAKRLQLLDVEVVDCTNIRAHLAEGMQVLTSLRKQWEYLVEFFQSMAFLINLALKSSNEFTSYSSQIKSRESQLQVRSVLHDEAYEAVKIAVLVKHLSKTYSEISTKFLMPEVASLDLMLSATDQSASDVQLQIRSMEIQDEIRRIIENGKLQLCQSFENRRQQLTEIARILDPIVDEKDKRENRLKIEEVVKEENDKMNYTLPAICTVEDD